MAGFAAGQTIFSAQLNAIGIPVTPTTTSSNGTVTSGTTETRDAVLGNYVFTALAGVRYEVTVTGRGISGSVANDRYALRIRNGGGSTPNAASPIVDHDSTVLAIVSGGNGVNTINHVVSFIPGAGAVTLSAFWVRVNGTGVGTPTGACQMYAKGIGYV